MQCLRMYSSGMQPRAELRCGRSVTLLQDAVRAASCRRLMKLEPVVKPWLTQRAVVIEDVLEIGILGSGAKLIVHVSRPTGTGATVV